MLIKAITLENFKGIREPVRIEFKPITLLFGPNSAGKSTILQALVYMREILERHNLDPDRTLLGGEWMDLGGFRSLVHNHDLGRTMCIGFELDITNEDLPDYLNDSEAWILESAEGSLPFPSDYLSRIKNIGFKLFIRWNELLEQPFIELLDIEINDSVILGIKCMPSGKDVLINQLDWKIDIFSDEESEEEDIESKSTHDDMMLIAADMAPSFTTDDEDEEDSVDNWFQQILNDAFSSERISSWLDVELPLAGQKDALPLTGRLLQIDRSNWSNASGEYANHPLAYQLLITSILSGIAVGPIDLVRRELEKLIYIGPLREVPARHMSYQRSPDISRWARGEAAWDYLHTCDIAFHDKVNDWIAIEERFNTGYFLERQQYKEIDITNPVMLVLSEDRMFDESEEALREIDNLPVQTRINLIEEKSGIRVKPQDVGVGISQLMPVIVAGLQATSGILAVEQPELHIHPALQVVLGDLFADQLKNSDALYLLETHSEHLMLRFLRRIRETCEEDGLPPGAPALAPDQIAVYYVRATDDGSEFTPQNISEDGDFTDDWPEGFFEERAKELF